jgi:hypothetical protein
VLEEIKEMWARDSKLDATRITDMIVEIPILHSKYIDLLSAARMKYQKADSDFMRLRRAKIRYYRGEMSRDELSQYGWEQWQGVKPLKTDLEELLSSDEDMLVKKDQVEYYRIVVNHIESIVKYISYRGMDIRTMAEYQRFMQGG